MGVKRCGAKAKSTGKPCRREAGWGTDHVGQGRCRFHGGSTPIKSGRYSTIRREGLSELIEKHKRDDRPLDVMEELAAARAILEDYVSRYDDVTEALLAWHGDAEKENRPRQVPDMADVINQIERITRIAQREKRLMLEGAVSRKDLLRIMTEVRRVIEHEADTDTAQRIIDGLRGIKLA